MIGRSFDSFSTQSTLSVNGKSLTFFSLPKLGERLGVEIGKLPYSLRILLENLLRSEDGVFVKAEHIERLAHWQPGSAENEIQFHPARVVLQDFTGVPAVVDLAAMREAMAKMGGDPARINPLFPSELVIDHSVQVDSYGSPRSLLINSEKEYERNRERYELLRWAQTAFRNFVVVPPATGIVHQVNLERLARVVFEQDGVAYPDTVVGTDSHTTMINGLGVLGWGVGGIEAEAAMLGQPINLLVPEVVGFRLFGTLPPGSTATDLVLTITRALRDKGVVGKFVEFYGPGVGKLPLANRATISNMSPEFGSTASLFPIDEETLSYVRLTGRSAAQTELIFAYARAQELFRTDAAREPAFSDTLELDLGSVEPTISGPKRPQDKVALGAARAAWRSAKPGLVALAGEKKGRLLDAEARVRVELDGQTAELRHGSVVIAAITSCTNTSNPYVMLGAGLLARHAREKGLTVKPWVKTSLAPGSKVVTGYLKRSGLLEDLEALRFHVVGYGCTTCIGNSGPLPDAVSEAVRSHDLVVVSVLSGNRNFEGRISPEVRANYLASPPLVVAYALAGTMDFDFSSEPLGKGRAGEDVFLKDIWPTPEEIQRAVTENVDSELFEQEYADAFSGDERWRALPVPTGDRYAWKADSTYARLPDYFDGMGPEPSPLSDIQDARVLALLGDSVTTDHISPAGSIAKDSPAGRYLLERGVSPRDFNSYGSRRGNHEVMVRGTFANIRLKNLLVPGTEGGFTRHFPDGTTTTIYDASISYRAEKVPLLVLAGKEYGSGSSRDWAAKGTFMLGVKAVIAESFERIHRSNLIGMGVLPLEFLPGQHPGSLGLTGAERFSIEVLSALEPGKRLEVRAVSDLGQSLTFGVVARIDTIGELEYYRHGGILHFVLRQLLREAR